MHTHLFSKKLRSSQNTESFLIFLLFGLLYFYCNQVSYFYCNQVKKWGQVSYRGVSYTKCVCVCVCVCVCICIFKKKTCVLITVSKVIELINVEKPIFYYGKVIPGEVMFKNSLCC